MAFPTLLNHCHHAKAPEPVELDHQATYCMSAAHRNCPVFLRSFAAPLPPQISAIPQSPLRKGVVLWGVMTAVVASLTVFLLFGGWDWANATMWFAEPIASNTPSFVLQPTTTPLLPAAGREPTQTPPPTNPTLEEAVGGITITFTSSPQPVGSATPRPQATQAATSCSRPSGWVQYIVRTGDTLSSISEAFGISVAQLQSANCLGSSTKIYTGQILWVPNRPTVTLKPTQPIDTPTFTPTLTDTLPPSNTPTPTLHPTDTLVPTDTPLPTDTPEPTATDEGTIEL